MNYILDAHLEYLEAIQMHMDWWNTDKKLNNQIHLILDKYNNAIKEMKDSLVQSMIHYNLALMSLASTFMIHVRLISIYSINYFINVENLFRFF